jgi:hypothetical protein
MATTTMYARFVKRARLFHRLTGLTPAEFDRLLDKFSSHYMISVIQPRLTAEGRKRKLGGGRIGSIPGTEDKLFFILIYTRIYPLLIIQGLMFGMSEGRACTWVDTLLPVLETSLGSAHVMPKRSKGRSLEEVIAEFPELAELGVLADGVERPIRRPKNKDQEKKNFSGKKKHHTVKNVTFVHPKNQYILAVSDEHPGQDHDKKIIDDEEIRCHSPINLGVDSGFVGLNIGRANIILPVKRQRRKTKRDPKIELTDAQKAYNHAQSGARIAVEHSNAGFKRNRSVQDILRNTRDDMSDHLMMVATGLHNLRVTMRASYQKS